MQTKKKIVILVLETQVNVSFIKHINTPYCILALYVFDLEAIDAKEDNVFTGNIYAKNAFMQAEVYVSVIGVFPHLNVLFLGHVSHDARP